MSETRMDVVIIGGGLVGGPLACALAQSGLRVAVIDHEPADLQLAPSYDGRASALALGPQRVLEQVGLWQFIEPDAAPIKDIRVVDGASPLFLHYDHRALGDDPFGWIVENRVMRYALTQRFVELPNLQLFAPVSVTDIRRESDAARLTLSNGQTLTAALVVAADGRRSPTRHSAGIGITSWGYDQTAIVCTIAHERPHRDVALEHFLPSGPFAILPLPGNRSSVVWSEKGALVPKIMAQSDDDFMVELSERFGRHLGQIRLEGPRFAYPLTLQLADAYTAPRLALIGDAAHGMHPVAGQGMNMGLRDVAALAEIVVTAHRLGQDIGAATVLDDYARWRRFDNLLMLALTDMVVRLFSNHVKPLAVARSLGLAAVQQLPGVKKFFMRHAMGLVGTLPKLMQGQPL